MINFDEFLVLVLKFCNLTGTGNYPEVQLKAVLSAIQKKNWTVKQITEGLKRISTSSKSTHKNIYGELCGAIEGDDDAFPGGPGTKTILPELPKDQLMANIRKQNAFFFLMNILIRIKPSQPEGWYDRQIERWRYSTSIINNTDYPSILDIGKQVDVTKVLIEEYCETHKVIKPKINMNDKKRNEPENLEKYF